MAPSSRFRMMSTPSSREASESPAASMSWTSFASRSNCTSPVDTMMAARPDPPPKKTRFPSNRTDWTSLTRVVVFHRAVPSWAFIPQTTPLLSTKTRTDGRATTKPVSSLDRVQTVVPVTGSMPRIGPVESTAKTRLPSVARGAASGASRDFSHRDFGGNGEVGARIGGLAQANERNKPARIVRRTLFDVVLNSPINACEV